MRTGGRSSPPDSLVDDTNPLILLVRTEGLEPSRAYAQGILSLFPPDFLSLCADTAFHASVKKPLSHKAGADCGLAARAPGAAEPLRFLPKLARLLHPLLRTFRQAIAACLLPLPARERAPLAPSMLHT
jgi:hypothetical protein